MKVQVALLCVGLINKLASSNGLCLQAILRKHYGDAKGVKEDDNVGKKSNFLLGCYMMIIML
jgi:hypothetical protein